MSTVYRFIYISKKIVKMSQTATVSLLADISVACTINILWLSNGDHHEWCLYYKQLLLTVSPTLVKFFSENVPNGVCVLTCLGYLGWGNTDIALACTINILRLSYDDHHEWFLYYKQLQLTDSPTLAKFLVKMTAIATVSSLALATLGDVTQI